MTSGVLYLQCIDARLAVHNQKLIASLPHLLEPTAFVKSDIYCKHFYSACSLRQASSLFKTLSIETQGRTET